MATPAFLDVFESGQLERLISQSIEVLRQPLNARGMGDVVIFAWDGHRISIENKQTDELLGDMDGCEDQLRKQLGHAEENLLLIRGVVVPAAIGVTTLKPSKSNPNLYHKSNHWNRPTYSGYRRWLYSLDKMGVTCIEVPTVEAAAMEIVTIYKYAQEKEHSTLNRYIKHKVRLQARDPYVETLMGVAGAGLGEARAKELIRVYGTPFCVFSQTAEELANNDGIGPAIAKRILKGVGR